MSGVARAASKAWREFFRRVVVRLLAGRRGARGRGGLQGNQYSHSMIGHRSPRHQAFVGAPRLDDLVNLPASRLSALLIIAAAALRKGRLRGRRLAP